MSPMALHNCQAAREPPLDQTATVGASAGPYLFSWCPLSAPHRQSLHLCRLLRRTPTSAREGQARC
eukprot:6546271-Alexandrium_andersonii.AAC.1